MFLHSSLQLWQLLQAVTVFLLPMVHCVTICPGKFLQGLPANIDRVTEWLFQDMQEEPSVYVTNSSVVFL